ncbi:MAG: ATP synthase F1 subunit gamma [Deltaproteobacteria bacterium]|nr:MAG: ATP synthase F1 subunit gamma [Deltaproteobacteria bacterium]
MASARELRRRIRSISSTAQITRAMQMVAASKMRKAQQAAIEVRPFVRSLYRIQRKATTRPIDFKHPLLAVREIRKRAIILVASDKGLCGALNSNLFRLVGQYDPHSTVFITAGRKGAQFVARTRRQLVADFPYGDTPRIAESRAIAALARDLFLKGEVDTVNVIATRFVNTLTQQAVDLEFLPIGDIKGVEIPGAPPAEAASDTTEFLFEPSAEDIIGYLLGHYLNIFIHLVLLNAKASEQSARMVSMKNATDNADAMIKDLTLDYNKLRQGRITQELLEIAGGQAE